MRSLPAGGCWSVNAQHCRFVAEAFAPGYRDVELQFVRVDDEDRKLIMHLAKEDVLRLHAVLGRIIELAGRHPLDNGHGRFNT